MRTLESERGCVESKNQKTPAASMKRRKWGLGVSKHIQMLSILTRIGYCTILVLNRVLFTGYRLCRRPLRLESPRTRCLELHVALHGYLVAWMAITLGSILEPLGSFGSLLGRLWVACGLYWVRQGAQMSYLAFLCRRQHQFEGPGRPKGSMWGLKVCRREIPCGPLWRRAVPPIEE